MLFLIAVLVVGLYAGFRYSTSLGSEAARAHAFLTMIRSGANADEANATVDQVMSDDTYHHASIYTAKQVFRAMNIKQKPVIGYAYRKGMKSKMSASYQQECSKMPLPSSAILLYEDFRRVADKPTKEHTDLDIRRKYPTWADYESALFNEIKRLDGKTPDELHYVQMMDSKGFEKAYADGVDLIILAEMFKEHEEHKKPTFQSNHSYTEANVDRITIAGCQLRNSILED
jgi:hypothetical protein